ncbi:DUF3473 domain-containing protein [Paenibacillus sp. MMO-177]|uniref:DUF3473 domain-containing protein n=1 Tax=Paenibacillus sp. MMO-177 TaxID=3081289 RepID=UPI0030172DB6
MRNALTVDVEDWYMTNGLNIPPSEWHRYDDRVVGSTTGLLDLFDRYKVKGTFFILGSVAQRHPGLIEDIARRGHEIASHGYWHQLVTSQSLEAFREDVRDSKEILERITGRTVTLYRAPSWSMEPERYEALNILAEQGFVCDSSMQPFRTPLSGIAGAPHQPFTPLLNDMETGVIEFPPSVTEVAGMTVPFSGGFYLRAIPYAFVKWALSRVNKTRPGMIYIHPWEIDPGQPRVQTSAFIKLIQYYGLNGTVSKLEQLLNDFSFQPLGEVIRSHTNYPKHRLYTPGYKQAAR